jgi:hypothetical protein
MEFFSHMGKCAAIATGSSPLLYSAVGASECHRTDFTASDSRGKTKTLDQYRGKYGE